MAAIELSKLSEKEKLIAEGSQEIFELITVIYEEECKQFFINNAALHTMNFNEFMQFYGNIAAKFTANIAMNLSKMSNNWPDEAQTIKQVVNKISHAVKQLLDIVESKLNRYPDGIKGINQFQE